MSNVNLILVLGLLDASLVGCTASSHATRPSTLGRPWSGAGLEAVIDQPGTVELETVVGADWKVPRSGVINLENPTAKAAHLEDGDEPIQIFAHILRHPTRGTFLVESGMSRQVVEVQGGAGTVL